MGLLTTFGNPFCGYDSLNVQTVSDTSAVIDEDTDIIIVEEMDGLEFREINLPTGDGTKVFIVFVNAPPNGGFYQINFLNEGQFVGSFFYNQGASTANSILNVVRFNGRFYTSTYW